MKNLFISLVVAGSLLFFATDLYAQGGGLSSKELAKETKTVTKSLQKDGWKMVDISMSIEGAVSRHLARSNEPGSQAISSTIRCGSIMSNCDRAAFTDALRKYAMQSEAFVREALTGDDYLNQASLREEFSKLYSQFEMLVQKEISGAVTPSFQVYKKSTKRGATETDYRAFYIINEEKASTARIRAMEQALKESEALQRYSERISEAVGQRFNVRD